MKKMNEDERDAWLMLIVSYILIALVFFLNGCATVTEKKQDFVSRDEFEYGIMTMQRKDEVLADLIRGAARSDAEIRSQLFERLRELELKFEEYKQKVY